LAKNICGIIFGEARSAEEAGRLSETMKNCPYVFASGTTSNKIYSVYIVPEEKKWWLKYPETNLKTYRIRRSSIGSYQKRKQRMLHAEQIVEHVPYKKNTIVVAAPLLFTIEESNRI